MYLVFVETLMSQCKATGVLIISKKECRHLKAVLIYTKDS